MATTVLKAMTEVGTHGVGNIAKSQLKTVSYGAVLETADVDQFTIVEITGYGEDGVAKCQPLSAKGNKGYLVCTVEQRLLGEELSKFYNAIGEKIRLGVFESDYTSFETSSFTKNTGVTTIARGMVAHFDVTTKKYIISAVGSEHADYAGSYNQFTVMKIEEDNAGHFDAATLSLIVTKAN